MHSELSVEGSESVALLVREELARRRLSRQWLADEARLSLSTLEKALAYIKDQSGQHFDPRVVEAFMAALPDE